MTNAPTAPAAPHVARHVARHLAEVPATFTREQGCSQAEWLGWLPGAVGSHPWRPTGEGRAEVLLDAWQPGARLSLDWQALEPRRIALLQMPRLSVRFAFEGCEPEHRASFMHYFDLYTRRGGG